MSRCFLNYQRTEGDDRSCQLSHCRVWCQSKPRTENDEYYGHGRGRLRAGRKIGRAIYPTIVAMGRFLSRIEPCIGVSPSQESVGANGACHPTELNWIFPSNAHESRLIRTPRHTAALSEDFDKAEFYSGVAGVFVSRPTLPYA